MDNGNNQDDEQQPPAPASDLSAIDMDFEQLTSELPAVGKNTLQFDNAAVEEDAELSLSIEDDPDTGNPTNEDMKMELMPVESDVSFSKYNIVCIFLTQSWVTKINFLVMISIHCQEIRLWEVIEWSPKRNALIIFQILSTHSLRKCMEFSLQNLYLDIGA